MIAKYRSTVENFNIPNYYSYNNIYDFLDSLNIIYIRSVDIANSNMEHEYNMMSSVVNNLSLLQPCYHGVYYKIEKIFNIEELITPIFLGLNRFCDLMVNIKLYDDNNRELSYVICEYYNPSDGDDYINLFSKRDNLTFELIKFHSMTNNVKIIAICYSFINNIRRQLI